MIRDNEHLTRLDGVPVKHNILTTTVIRKDDVIYKVQPLFFTDNEMWALQELGDTGFVPVAERVDDETICMEFIETEKITDPDRFRRGCDELLMVMSDARIKHGDISPPHVLVRYNYPVLIDWSESRYWYDPRPSKRRESDAELLHAVMEEMIDGR